MADTLDSLGFTTQAPASGGSDLNSLGFQPVDDREAKRKQLMDMINNGPTDRFRNAFSQALANGVIGLADLGISGANLLPGVNVNKIQPITSWSSGDTAVEKAGGLAGSLFGFGKGTQAVNAIKKIPMVAEGAEKALEYLGKVKGGQAVANAVTSPLAKSVAGNALFGAVYNPNDQLTGAAEGGALGAVGHGLGALLGTQNPIVKAGAGAVAGAIPGYMVGGKTGAEMGAVGGLGLALYPGAGSRGVNSLLSKLNLADQDELGQTMQAGRNIGVIPRPTEVTGSPEMAAMEGKILSTPQGQAQLYKSGQERLGKEQNAIGGLLDDITPKQENVSGDVRAIAKNIQSGRESSIHQEDQAKIDDLMSNIHPDETDASSDIRGAAKSIIDKQVQVRREATKPLYDAANQGIIPDSTMRTIMQDPNLNRRWNQTITNDENIYDRQKLPAVNSIGTLDSMRQDLADEIRSAEKGANPDYKQARKLKQQLSVLDDAIDNAGEAIRGARAAYKEESKPIDALKNSPIGKIANMKDKDLKNVASTIFDRKQTNLDSFNQIRDQISQENPELWRRIMRNAIDDRIAKVKSGDPGAIFYKNILGSRRDFEQFYNAARDMPEVRQQLENLRQQFPESSQKLKELRKPMIARIANMNDSQLKNVSKTIFDSNQTDPKMFSDLRDQISKQNPDVWKSLMRNEIERRMSAKGEGVGTHFYDQVLKDDNSFNQFIEASKGMPKVQKKLKDMRQVFSKLINQPKPDVAYNEARTGQSKGILASTSKKIAQIADNLISGAHDKALLKLLTDDTWDSQFSNLAKIDDRKRKAEKFGELLAKIANAATANAK